MKTGKPPVRAALLLVLPAMSLAGCGDPAEEEPVAQPTETVRPVEPGGGIGDGATPPSPPPEANRTDAIPAAMHGRWGLTPADCERPDAQGLLTVAPQRLTFYESVGELGSISARSDDRIRGSFAYTGEGMTWTRDLSLSLQDGGRTLVRRDHEGEASPGAFRYTRCP